MISGAGAVQAGVRLAALLAASVLLPGALAGAAHAASALPFELHGDADQRPEARGIRLLGSIDLTPLRAVHEPLVELSGLAWDEDEDVLLAVSDRGWLVTLRPVLVNDRLRDVQVLDTQPLRDRQGRALAGRAADAEGLALRGHRDGRRGNTTLLVSYERRARIDRHAPDGRWRGREPLATALRDEAAYQSANKGLEAVSDHPRLGLLTAPEFPLPGTDQDRHTVYGAGGALFSLPRLRETNAGLVGLESLPDGRIVSLQRAHSWLTLSLVVELRIATPPAEPGPALRDDALLARLDSALGWRVDNFEGLAWQRGGRFFMVSDDNGSGLQKTLLVAFELRDG